MSGPVNHSPKDFGWIDLYIGEAYSDMKHVAGAHAPRIPVPDSRQELIHALRLKCMEGYPTHGESEFAVNHEGTMLPVTQMTDVTNSNVIFIRRPDAEIRRFATLGLPPHAVMLLLDNGTPGLILYAGEIGVGKTTSAASLVLERLMIHGGLAIANEDPPVTPLNGLHGPGRCIEVPASRMAGGYREHLIKSMRGSADLILIGEIRDTADGVQAVTASSNGRLVISTIHARDIPDALSRNSTWCAELPNNNDQLADGLSAVIWQTIERQPAQPGRLMLKTLSIGAGDTGIRTKIRKAEFGQLHQDIEQQLRQPSWSTENLFGGTRT
ncbi:ATPase, T2SS/T4P/T4SS family [Pseudomonas aeruginosa]|uniref:ATPase, T2SS/T4P/T4SS family n=1 Tax=Pseudomonas aeruginosa TaxID=287 RepID=UPI001E3D3CFE|nr:ATPase, T2SS/T4P/T4SS family [Pseudomonas aeruginosa]MCC9290096.1 type IV pilus twitching motility protein PilT [Pseudomonas aeruginosa]UVN19098.1 type II secretion system protein E [Pseudomonas aeruginosa]